MTITNLSAIWNNNIIFTNFDEAIFGVNCPTNSKKIFYLWDLDWNTYNYSRKYMINIMNKCDYLFLRSPEHIDPVRSFFGRTADGINTNFDLQIFEKV